jgi:ABC-2 type transport system ATP-binding protein
VIFARGLHKRYGERVAVSDLSFEVRPGETLGLLGPNGAGKSTTIAMLVGATQADRGEIEIDGARDPRRPEVRRRLGLAPQALAIYPELTAAENLSFFGRLYGLRGAALAARVEYSLAFAGLADRRHDRTATYSGGMQRRLNLAAALIHDPQVVLLDEPTVGVDPQSRNHMFDAISALKRSGCTILYTTHYMEEATRLCDRVAIVDHGRLLAVGTVDELVAAHGGPAMIEAEIDGTSRSISSNEPMREVAALVAGGGSLTRLTVNRPDLEAVFLSLTGRKLRD